VFAFLAKIGIGSIVNRLASAYEAREKAKTEHEKLAADIKVKGLEARASVQRAESRWFVNTIIRGLFAIPVAYYYGKIFIYDKALGLGSTDPLSDELVWTARVIIGFYFLYETTQGLRR
jgi:hypothetical protein